jgi:hypothetical protein
MLDHTKAQLDSAVSKFAHITRSRLAQLLMEAEDRGQLETVSVPFEGDADRAHRKTASLRKTMARHGRRLYYKREPGKLLLWAKTDSTINPVDYISKPRRKQ